MLGHCFVLLKKNKTMGSLSRAVLQTGLSILVVEGAHPKDVVSGIPK
ncbi:hypothetical protein VCRA2119O147_2670003 [Vibrio crassostreae]|nr:hypothetical protein VCRA2117O378_360048 [Vibrio crassostreae]CAK2158348.1 hypothetical protein VCRA2117O37_600003 [Vibrio crassostreae]CAK2160127.1 hypothetical protein VCRA2117O40_560003 [Vibrio crassostreae]CAK2166254.1 hypothetical protein VCRA2119O46_590003 [Vibrio crassostreae]CAK2181427.1 hypothetical protein VCRA2113O22_620003 [Vibrio crassostreae]